MPLVTVPTAPAGFATGSGGGLICQATQLIARIAAASSGVAEKPANRLKISKNLARELAATDDGRAAELQAIVDALRKIAG
ncbi:MAG: hypothetical protein ACKOI2_07510 [Actinomycetota bacterium]